MQKAICISAFFILLFFSCKKKTTETVTIVKDCTGVYLRFDSKDHPVCNPNIITNYQDGAIVHVTFVKAGKSKCDNRDAPHCTGVHPYTADYNDWLIIADIK